MKETVPSPPGLQRGVTFRSCPKGLAGFHLIQLEDCVVKAGGVDTSGVSSMTSDTATNPATLEPKLSGTRVGGGIVVT